MKNEQQKSQLFRTWKTWLCNTAAAYLETCTKSRCCRHFAVKPASAANLIKCGELRKALLTCQRLSNVSHACHCLRLKASSCELVRQARQRSYSINPTTPFPPSYQRPSFCRTRKTRAFQPYVIYPRASTSSPPASPPFPLHHPTHVQHRP